MTLIGISHAPIAKLQAYKRRMGWQFPYVSSFRSDFNYDFGASFTEEQQREIAEQVLPEFSKDDAVAELAASCGTDLAGYVTTEAPGLNAFAIEDGVVYHTYSADPREVGFMVFYEQLLERAEGRQGGRPGNPSRRIQGRWRWGDRMTPQRVGRGSGAARRIAPTLGLIAR